MSQHILFRPIQELSRLGLSRLHRLDCFRLLLAGCLRIWLGKDRSQRNGNDRIVTLRDVGQSVSHEVHPTALPGDAAEHLTQNGLEAFMSVASDQPDVLRPRRTKVRRKFSQKASPSPLPRAKPSTSRSPISRTPMAITIVWPTMR